MNLAIIGCGLIGKKRANNIGDHRITWVADVQKERAEALAGEFGSANATSDWSQAVTADNVDAVIIATTHDQLVPVGLKAERHPRAAVNSRRRSGQAYIGRKTRSKVCEGDPKTHQ